MIPTKSITVDIQLIDNGLLLRTGGRPTCSDPLAQTEPTCTFYPHAEALSEGLLYLTESTFYSSGNNPR